MSGSTVHDTSHDRVEEWWPPLYLMGAFCSTVAYWVAFKTMFQTIGVDSHGISRAAAFLFFAGFIEYFSKGQLLWIGLAAETSKGGTCKEYACQVIKTCTGGSMFFVALVSLQVAYQLGEGFSVLYLAASLFALIRNLKIPCVAMLARLWFGEGKGHTQYQWTLLLGITFGASLAVLLGQNQMTSRATYTSGVVIALVVVLLSSMKSVLEQGILHAKEMSPLLLAGLQGVLCCTAMAVVLAGAHFLGVENFWDTLALLRSSTPLTIHVIVFGFVCMVDTWLGTMVTLHYDSTVKVTVSSTTPFGIWAIQLGIHSFEPLQGEPWLYPTSLWYLLSMVATVALVITFIRTKRPHLQLINAIQIPHEKTSILRFRDGLQQP